jgi:hypothetical protein
MSSDQFTHTEPIPYNLSRPVADRLHRQGPAAYRSLWTAQLVIAAFGIEEDGSRRLPQNPAEGREFALRIRQVLNGIARMAEGLEGGRASPVPIDVWVAPVAAVWLGLVNILPEAPGMPTVTDYQDADRALADAIRLAGGSADGSAVQDPPGGWSKPNSPAVWAKVFGMGRAAFVRAVKKGAIQAKTLSDRSYRIAVRELPEDYRRKNHPGSFGQS